MLYLVSGTIEKYEYYCERVEYPEVRLVNADSPEEAEEKFEKYFASQSEYDTKYYVRNIDVKETI